MLCHCVTYRSEDIEEEAARERSYPTQGGGLSIGAVIGIVACIAAVLGAAALAAVCLHRRRRSKNDNKVRATIQNGRNMYFLCCRASLQNLCILVHVFITCYRRTLPPGLADTACRTPLLKTVFYEQASSILNVAPPSEYVAPAPMDGSNSFFVQPLGTPIQSPMQSPMHSDASKYPCATTPSHDVASAHDQNVPTYPPAPFGADASRYANGAGPQNLPEAPVYGACDKESLYAKQATISTTSSGERGGASQPAGFPQLATRSSLTSMSNCQNLRPGTLPADSSMGQQQQHVNLQLDSLANKEVLGGLMVLPGEKNRRSGGALPFFSNRGASCSEASVSGCVVRQLHAASICCMICGPTNFAV